MLAMCVPHPGWPLCDGTCHSTAFQYRGKLLNSSLLAGQGSGLVADRDVGPHFRHS